jgi:hypothetical protein
MNHFISEIVITFLAMLKVNNMPIIVGFSFIEGLLLLMLYREAFVGKTFKRSIIFLIVAFIVGLLGIYTLIDKKLSFSLSAYSFQHIILLIPVILYFAERMIRLDDIFLAQNPMFWISSGFLIFYSVGIFYFTLFNNLFVHNKEIFIKGWAIHSIALITMNLLLTRGIWLIQKD